MIENIVAEKSAKSYPLSMKGLGNRIAQLRFARKPKWNQGKLEADLNTSIDKLAKIATALSVTVGDLLPEDQLPKPASVAGFSPDTMIYHQWLETVLKSEWRQGIIDNLRAMIKALGPEGEHGPFDVTAERLPGDTVEFKKPRRNRK